MSSKNSEKPRELREGSSFRTKEILKEFHERRMEAKRAVSASGGGFDELISMPPTRFFKENSNDNPATAQVRKTKTG